jgi:hypothetical protein
MWQILSHDYDTHGAFYGVKNAAEPVHVQMNLPDYQLMVINNPAAALNGATLSYAAYDVKGKLLASGDKPVAVAAVSTSEPIDAGIAALLAQHKLIVLRLVLKDADGKVLSQNAYWPSSTLAGQQGLNQLATVPLELTTRWTGAAVPGERQLEVTMRNGGEVPALSGKLTLFNADGERILPVYFSDNYVALMPGESRTVTVTFKSQGAVRLDLRGWNVAPQSLPVGAQ